MDKKIEELTYPLKEEVKFGSIKIANDVIAQIAGIAAVEVDGVNSMAGNVGNNILSMVGVGNVKKGVKIEISGKEVSLDLSLVVEFGYNIPSVSAKVQEKVKSTVESMTGLKASNINIRIAGVAQV